MPLPVLCFLLIAITAVAGDLIAEGTGDAPPQLLVEQHLDSLQSDSPATRQRAMQQLLQLASDADAPTRESQIQRMLRYSLCSDLETQLSVNRLVEEIKILEYRERVDGLLRSGGGQEQRSSRLGKSWEIFSSRASRDVDAQAAFRQIALRAGPSLHWHRLHRRVPQNELDIVLISHLGCLAPQTPHLFGRHSRDLFSQLMKMPGQSNFSIGADVRGRVMGRLIDRTLLENIYGWTIPERLHLALAYRRGETAASLHHQVLASDEPLARDLAAAMLAGPRIAALTGHGGASRISAPRVREALHDRRVVCVASKPLLGEPLRAGNGARNQLVHRGAIVHTRVQDVAGWVLIQGGEIDAREFGMMELRADPVWGIDLSSIGFDYEPARERFLSRVQAQLAPQD